MRMSKRMAESLITKHGWQPYIKSHWLDFTKNKGGYVIGFKNHSLEYQGTRESCKHLLELAKLQSEP
jgi:hypothetical protein